jgi:hypothetical protein
MYFSYAKEQLPCQLMFGAPDPPNPPKTAIILFVGQIVPTNRSVARCQFFLHSVKRDPCEEATKSASGMVPVAGEYSVFGNSAHGPRGQPWVAVKPSRSSLNLESTLRPHQPAQFLFRTTGSSKFSTGALSSVKIRPRHFSASSLMLSSVSNEPGKSVSCPGCQSETAMGLIEAARTNVSRPSSTPPWLVQNT